MNWLIFGLKNLYKNKGFVESAVIKQEVTAYREENNNVYAFAEECLAFEDGLMCTKKDVYARYCKYCGENGYKAFAIKKMGKELKKIYPNIKDFVHAQPSVRCWKNMGLLTD